MQSSVIRSKNGKSATGQTGNINQCGKNSFDSFDTRGGLKKRDERNDARLVHKNKNIIYHLMLQFQFLLFSYDVWPVVRVCASVSNLTSA